MKHMLLNYVILAVKFLIFFIYLKIFHVTLFSILSYSFMVLDYSIIRLYEIRSANMQLCNFFAVISCNGMPDDIRSTSEIVYSAMAGFIQFCHNAINAKICMTDIAKYGNSALLKNLCDAANSGKTLLCPSFNQVKGAMDSCFKKCNYVENYCKMMEVVVKHCSKISKGTQFYMFKVTLYNIYNIF